MNKGWISIHRKLLENPICKKPQYLSLWIILLLKANHSENNFIWNNEEKSILPGQFITGRLQLSKESGISESTIEKILKFFEKNNQIEQQKTNKFRLILIKNWEQYQTKEQQDIQQRNNRRTTKRQQEDTNNNGNNGNNGNNENNNIISSEVSTSPPIGKIMNLFYEFNPGLNFGNKSQRNAVDWLLKKMGEEKLIGTISYYRSIAHEKYSPKITTPLELKNKLGDLINFYNKSISGKTPDANW